MNIKIYADGANIDDIIEVYKSGEIDGFTTNPSLMKQAGVKDYKAFAKELTTKIKDLPISFEVFSDDFETMKKEAIELSKYGDNVYVKIPIQNTRGEISIDLIRELSEKGINLNITAIFTVDQVRKVVDAVNSNSNTIVSVFAGRIADAGVDPMPIMKESLELCKSKDNVKLLWASVREIYNLIQAEEIGCDIITITNDILNKRSGLGISLEQRSLDTVKQFYDDVKELGFSII